jgi:hypothetical protein
MNWRSERPKLQVTEDRGHFGLAWSVLAAYGIAVVVLLYGWHPRTSGIIGFRFVAIIVFMLVGAVGVLGAFAAAFRKWPHNPRKRDIARYEDVKGLYLGGLGISQGWGEDVIKYLALYDSGSMVDEDYRRRDEELIERIREAIKWRNASDQSIVNWFGESACRTFITEPQISSDPPSWQRGDQWFINWNEVAGRLVWLRRWLLEQDDL